MANYSDPGIAPRVGVYAGGAKTKAKKRAMPMPMKPKRRRLGLLAGMRGTK